MKKDEAFYRHITRRNNGYQLRYKGEHYGWYENIEDALFDRDRLEQCDWNMSIFVELAEIPNPYYHMDLPPYTQDSSYITYVPARYRIQKVINGKLKNFGEYKLFEDAKLRRDELIANGWEK